MHVGCISIKNNLLLPTSIRELTTFMVNYCTKNLLAKRYRQGLQWDTELLHGDIVGGLGLIITLISRGCMEFQGAGTGAEESGRADGPELLI